MSAAAAVMMPAVATSHHAGASHTTVPAAAAVTASTVNALVTPPAASTGIAAASVHSHTFPAHVASSSSSSSFAVAAAPSSPSNAPSVAPASSASSSSDASGFLGARLSAWSVEIDALEVKFAAKKAAFRNSLQETINSWTGKGADAHPAAPTPPHARRVLRSQHQQQRPLGMASVTYRPPMRDPEDSSRGYSSHQTGEGPRSSFGGVGSEAGAEQSVTVGAAESQWRSRTGMQKAELSALPALQHEHHYDDEEDEEQVYADYANVQGGGVDAVAEEPSLSGCKTLGAHASMTMHKDDCTCDLHARDTLADCEATPVAAVEMHEVAISVAVAASAAAPTSSCPSLSHPHDHSPSVSLHIHGTSESVDISANGVITHSSRRSSIFLLSSTLDPHFVVAPISAEFLLEDHWDDSAGPYAHGHLVPRAPRILCDCAYPWRSLTHLWTEHVQPESHARNMTFEGGLYPKWRGQFYPNGEPKAVLRGVSHELGFIAVVAYSIVLFLSVSSWIGFLAGGIHVASQLMLYGTSSQFHRRVWLLPLYNKLKRADHSCIFILAAGSSTPSALLLLRHSDPGVAVAGAVLLAWAWGGALGGVLYSIVKPLQGKVSPFGLVWMGVVGACMVPFVYQLHQAMLTFEFACVITAWLLYLAAVLTYARGWGNTWPSVFGYHETFHAITIIGGVVSGVFNFSICARLT